MSGKLVSCVWQSGLVPWLKPIAAVYASYADDDGANCFPSIKTVAGDLGRSERQAQAATSTLRRLGILRVVQGRAPYRSTFYQFIVDALPARPGQLPLLFENQSFPQAKPAKCSEFTRFPQFPQALTGSGPRHNRKSTSPDPS